MLFLMRVLLMVLCLGLTAPPPAAAQDLDAVERQLAQSRKEQLEREAHARAVAKELETARRDLTALAAQIRENETAITALEDRITDMTGEQQQLTVRLEADYGSIGNLVLALQRLRRTPPEALIIRPGAPLQTAQTALLLESVLPSVSRRADALAQDLDRLATLRAALDSDRATLETTSVTLAERRKDMDRLVKEREKLHAAADSARTAAAAEVKRLAAEADDIRELMQKLAEQQAAEDARRRAQGGTRTATSSPATLPGLGKAQSPAAGVITVGYGDIDDIGAKSEGITIETAANAIVVAPMGGIVRFSGPFKNYGNMVIIEHKKDYHSLLGGLHRLDVREGDSVNAGEPVGVLPGSPSRGGKPALYYELRQKGRPVNPSSTFAGLRS